MALQLSYTLAKKIVNRCLFSHDPPERIDKPEISQTIKIFMQPDVVFKDPDTGSTISIGSFVFENPLATIYYLISSSVSSSSDSYSSSSYS